MTTLQLADVSTGWGGCAVLRGVSLSCTGGEVLGVLGPNGAGKSTLLSLLAGDAPLLAGHATLLGKHFKDWQPSARAAHLAYLPQVSTLAFPFTVDEVLQLGRLPHRAGRACDQRLIGTVRRWTDIESLGDRLYPLLSGGEQQRVQLARVLVQLFRSDPDEALDGRVLLLDEPTAALDLGHQQLLLNALRNLAQRGCTVLVAMHDINLLASLADRVLVLAEGQARALGAPATLFTSDFLRDLYDTDLLVQAHPRRGYPLVFPA